MTLQGTVVNGAIVSDGMHALPEGALVWIELATSPWQRRWRSWMQNSNDWLANPPDTRHRDIVGTVAIILRTVRIETFRLRV